MLASFPEELVEHILADAVVAPPTPHPRASWHQQHDSGALRTRIAPLLVCRAFHRIGLQSFYHTVVLHTPSQSNAFLKALRAQPALARSVRTLVLLAPGPADAEVLRLLSSAGNDVQSLDITLPNTITDESSGPDGGVAQALRELRGLRDLSVRKGAATYLSQPAARAVLDALAHVVDSCPSLESTTLSFPLSADPALASLVSALSTAPALHTLRTPLPALWSPPLLTVSANPSLTKICLGDDLQASSPVRRSSDAGLRAPHGRRPVLGTSLFLAVARTHAHLADLIRAGTAVVGWRSRAWTVGSVDAPVGVGAESQGRLVASASGAC